MKMILAVVLVISPSKLVIPVVVMRVSETFPAKDINQRITETPKGKVNERLKKDTWTKPHLLGLRRFLILRPYQQSQWAVSCTMRTWRQELDEVRTQVGLCEKGNIWWSDVPGCCQQVRRHLPSSSGHLRYCLDPPRPFNAFSYDYKCIPHEDL